jgi:hypothetical protein
MTEAPVRLPPGHTIPIRSNGEIAKIFEQEDIAQLNDVSRTLMFSFHARSGPRCAPRCATLVGRATGRNCRDRLLTRLAVLRLLTNKIAMNGMPVTPDEAVQLGGNCKHPRSLNSGADRS